MATGDGDFGDGSSYLTPFDIFFNTSDNGYQILNVNFFNVSGAQEGSFVRNFRESVSLWFYAMRMIATIILLCILIYVGIRMALSSVAEDRAKYKKMLVDWVCSLALIFLLQYIALGIIYLNDAIVKSLRTIMVSLSEGNVTDFINSFMNELVYSSTLGVGITSFVSLALYCGIVAQTIMFFVAYVNRMLKVGFLIIISPLISITYSIDKMGDGKAQALNNWLKEFAYTILIQPFHCIMYIALINTAFKLVQETQILPTNLLPALLKSAGFNQLANGVLVILCLKFVKDGEEIVRKIFGFADDNSKTSMAAGAIASMALINNANRLGVSTRKGINTAKNGIKTFSSAVGSDASKVKNAIGNKLPKGLTNNLSKAKAKTNGNFGKLVSNTKNSKIGKKALKLKNKAKTFKENHKYKGSGLQKAIDFSRNKIGKNMPKALGMMAMAMAYATGDTNLLEANAIRSGITEGSQEFFDSTTHSQAYNNMENLRRTEKRDYKKVENSLKEANEKIEGLGYDRNISAEEVKNMMKSDKFKKMQKKAEQMKNGLDTANRMVDQAKQDLAKAQSKKANAKTSAEEQKASQEIFRAQQVLKAREDSAKRAEELYNSSQSDVDTYKELEKAVNERDSKQSELDNFNTDEAKYQRMVRKTTGPSQSELEDSKNRILQLILKLQKEQNNNSGPSSDKEIEDAVNIANYMSNKINRDVANNEKEIDTENMINQMGFKNNSNTFNELNEALEEYSELQSGVHIAKQFQYNQSYSNSTESLMKAFLNRL